MIIENTIGAKGKQRLDVYSGGELVRTSGDHNNMILDYGFDCITNPSSDFSMTGYEYHGCVVGTGSTPPIASDELLASPLYAKKFTSFNPPVLRKYIGLNPEGTHFMFEVVRVFSFAEGEVVGNISEVGTIFKPNSSVTTSAKLHTRALVKDAGGSPTAITVLATEQLVITHTLTTYVPKDPQVVVFPLNDGAGGTTDHTFKFMPVNFSNSYAINFFCIFDSYNQARGRSHYIRGVSDNIAGTVVNPGDSVPRFLYGTRYTLYPTTRAIYTPGLPVTEMEDTSAYSSEQANLANGIGFGIWGGGYATDGDDNPMGFTVSPNIPKDSRFKLEFTFKTIYARM